MLPRSGALQLKIDWAQVTRDIGSNTCEQVKEVIERAQTIVWSGLFGVCECGSFQGGTRDVVDMLVAAHDENEKAVFVGGGSLGVEIKGLASRDQMYAAR